MASSRLAIATKALDAISRAGRRSGDQAGTIAELAADALVDIRDRASVRESEVSLDEIVAATSRRLARFVFIREFGEAEARRVPGFAHQWIEDRVGFFAGPARELLEAIVPLIAAADPVALLGLERPARSLAEAEALASSMPAPTSRRVAA